MRVDFGSNQNYRGGHPDGIWQMPGMSGLDALIAIRKVGQSKQRLFKALHLSGTSIA